METETLNMIVVAVTAIAATIPPALFGWFAFRREAKAKREDAKVEYQRSHEKALFERKMHVAEAAMVSLVRVIDHYHNMILILDNMEKETSDSQSVALGIGFDANYQAVEKLAYNFENSDRALLGLYFEFTLPEYLRFESKQAITDQQLKIHAITEEFNQWTQSATSSKHVSEEMRRELENLQIRWKQAIKDYKEVIAKVFIALNETCNLIKAELRSDRLPSTDSTLNWPQAAPKGRK
jgi:hypothetical protein